MRISTWHQGRAILLWMIFTGADVSAQDSLAGNESSKLRAPVAGLQVPGPIRSQPMRQDDISRWITQFSADVQTIQSRYRVPLDEQAIELYENMLDDWRKLLISVSFEKLNRTQQVDYILLRNEIDYRLSKSRRENERDRSAAKIIPFAHAILEICKAREDVMPLRADEMAERIHQIQRSCKEEIGKLKGKAHEANGSLIDPTMALRASQLTKRLKRSLEEMQRFYQGYDPEFDWWTEQPCKALYESMDEFARLISSKLAGIDESDRDRIVGQPIGSEGLQSELEYAMIPYSAEELVAMAEREFAWCEEEGKKAANELGFEGDWLKALAHVKRRHVEPGQQPALIRELAWEAIHFLEAHDLLTIPPMAAHGWRMDMMSADAQRVNPYFLGGDRIIVSFPTNAMSHEEKLMSLRSNNIHFCRATVHHELIPGHHMQHYATARYHPYRQLFDTPFWVEGWALYWEMLLWDLGFAQGPEDRIGMLFWRKHRCARIIFSLNYQLGRWTPEQCVEYIREKVGHEPSAAAAEVRRSIMGGYGPLYQAAYMLGGLQIRSLHRQLVQNGKWTNREFHDAVLQQNSIPIEMIRAALTDVPLSADYKTSWRFAHD